MALPAVIAARLAAQRAAEGKLLRKAVQHKQSMVSKLPARLKKVQLVLDIIKIISLVVALFTGGLDGMSLLGFFVTANGELLAPLVWPWFKQQLWRKVIIIVLDLFVIFAALSVAFVILYIKENPREACALLGGAALGPIGAGLGWAWASVQGCGL